MDHRLRFLTSYLRHPHIVGALAPSSPALAAALCEPFERRDRPAKVLEIGAGTGAVTRHLGPLLGDADELDICELHSGFADVLERDVLSRPEFAPGLATGRIRLLRVPVQDLDYRDRYDFIISGLPLTVFELRDVRDVFRVIRRSLRPGGVLSYFEYVGLRRTSRFLSLGRRRTRIRRVSAYLSRNIRNHQFERTIVLQNLPPAHARHLRFGGEDRVEGPYRRVPVEA
jgi:phospholipid N-methyltransferase